MQGLVIQCSNGMSIILLHQVVELSLSPTLPIPGYRTVQKWTKEYKASFPLV